MSQEFFTIECPACRNRLKASPLAAALPDEVLLAETARRNGRRQTPHAGPGRPSVARCPGCDVEMRANEMRDHRSSCVQLRLTQVMQRGFTVHLSPKDPDPHPDFRIVSIDADYVRFEKLSSDQHLEIEFGKVAEITVDQPAQIVDIRLLGRVIWKEEARYSEWRFIPSRIGRPRVG